MGLLRQILKSMRRWVRYQIDPAAVHREIMIPLNEALNGVIPPKT